MKGGLLMYRYRKFIHILIFAFIVAVVGFNTKYNPFIQNEAVEWTQSVEDVAKTEDALYKEIEQKESEYIERPQDRSEEHTSELQSRGHLVCRLLLENKKTNRLSFMR